MQNFETVLQSSLRTKVTVARLNYLISKYNLMAHNREKETRIFTQNQIDFVINQDLKKEADREIPFKIRGAIIEAFITEKENKIELIAARFGLSAYKASRVVTAHIEALRASAVSSSNDVFQTINSKINNSNDRESW